MLCISLAEDASIIKNVEIAIKNKVTIIDFPGFGCSETPDFAYTIYDYTELLHEFLKELDIKSLNKGFLYLGKIEHSQILSNKIEYSFLFFVLP